jgi:hypothetical protein
MCMIEIRFLFAIFKRTSLTNGANIQCADIITAGVLVTCLCETSKAAAQAQRFSDINVSTIFSNLSKHGKPTHIPLSRDGTFISIVLINTA